MLQTDQTKILVKKNKILIIENSVIIQNFEEKGYYQLPLSAEKVRRRSEKSV